MTRPPPSLTAEQPSTKPVGAIQESPADAKKPRHCEEPTGDAPQGGLSCPSGNSPSGNPVDSPGCSVDHGIATPCGLAMTRWSAAGPSTLHYWHRGNGTGAVPYGPHWPPELPGCRSGGFTRVTSSNIHQSRVCQRRLAAAKTKGPPGGRVVLLSDSGEGGRNRLEEAFAVRHCQPDASHYSKEPQFRQSLESKINT